MELGFPLKLIYLTKFTKIFMSYVVFKKTSMGKKKSQMTPGVSNFAALER